MAVDFKDYYRILGVDRKADDKTIKSAYRRLARKHHPDVAKTKDATERFKEISEAYEVLSDPEKRRRYDSLGPDWQRYTQAPPGGPGGGFRVEYGGDDLGNLGDFSEFFRTIFGDPGAQARRGTRGGGMRVDDLFDQDRRSRGGDVQANVEISLDEAFHGARKTFAMDLEEPCGTCHGAGNIKGKPCAACGGGGWQRSHRQVDVKIPAGVRSGQRVRVSGEGSGAAGARGDLYLSGTGGSHPLFERQGDDVHLTLPVTPSRAALGTTLRGPTAEASPCTIERDREGRRHENGQAHREGAGSDAGSAVAG